MADPFTSGIHIVTCDDPNCVEQFIRMCEDLEKKDVVCVEEGRGDYGFGSFKDKFKEKVELNFYTVIHLCPEMVKKLSPVEQILVDERYQAKYVYINTKSTPRDLPKVYKDATRLRLYNESDYKNIVERLTKYVHAKLHKSSSAPQLSSAAGKSSAPQQPQVPQHQTLRKTYAQHSPERHPSPMGKPPEREQRGQFNRARSRELSFDEDADEPEDVTFFESIGDVHYHNSRLKHSDPSLLRFSRARDLEEIYSRSELYTRENLAKTVLWFQTKVLPEVARSCDVASVAVLLKSQIALIREKAQQVFMKILFSKEIGDISEPAIKPAEQTLFDQAMSLKARKDNSHEASEVICIYLVTLVHKIVASNDQNKQTSPFFARRIHVLQTTENKLDDVKAFVEDFRERRELYIRAMRAVDGKDFQNKKIWQSQFIVALRTIMEIFHGDVMVRHEAFLTLTNLLKPNKSGQRILGRSEVRPHPRVCNLITFGITSFLKSVEERTGEDFTKEIHAAFEVLKKCPDVLSGNVKVARDLVFSSNNLIRQNCLSLLTNTNLYSDIVHFMALSDISDKLQPINIDLTEAQRKSGSPKSDSWLKLPVGRVSERTMLHIHLPKEADHREQLKSTLDSADCSHRNTMEILGMLKSQPHILPLFAFRLEQIPVFYVTEDYSQPNLKQVLFSKAKHKQFLQPVELLELLLQALDALEYLQKNWIVHRDITASSFTYSREHNQVKLYRFDLARRCEVNQDLVIDRKCSGIPTRWSAPESLSQCHFSFRSDNWMVGHLIYEVITHGTLPYSDLDRKSEAEVAELIKRGTKKLPQERCIPTKVFVAIAECTKPNDNDRLSLSEARCQLEETQHEYNSISRRTVRLTENDFPNLSRMDYGDPHRGPAGEFASKRVFPRTTSKMCMAEMEADSEEMPLEPNTRLLYQIPTIFRVIEEETKLVVKEQQKRLLTQEEESFLLTNKLDGFSDHVTVIKYEDGEALSYSIPIDCQGNLQSLVNDRYLGEDSLNYIRCLSACAQALVKLHGRRWIHGALSSRNIWIKFRNNRTIVYFSELAYMRESRDDGTGIVSDVAQPPEEDVVIRRSAPEVIHGGTYSTACDVFSFAHVVCDVLTALDDIYLELNKFQHVPTSELYEFLTTEPGSKIQLCPSECPLEIYELLKLCWTPERHDRPSMAMVFNKLNEYIQSKSFAASSMEDIYDDPEVDIYGYEDIYNIFNDGPDRSLGSRSQVYDIGEIAPSTVPTTISSQESETHNIPMLRRYGDESSGKQEHMEKFMSQQPEPSTSTSPNYDDQPSQYRAPPGSQYQATSGNQYQATSGSQYQTTSGNQCQATSRSQYQATFESQYLATSGSQHQATPGRQYQATSGNQHQATPGRQYQATSGSQFKLAEQLPGVGAPAATTIPPPRSLEHQASFNSVATPSDIGSDVLSPMRAEENFRNTKSLPVSKLPPPVPKKPPPHLRIYKQPSHSLEISSQSEDDDNYEMCLLNSEPLPKTREGVPRQSLPESTLKPRRDNLPGSEAPSWPETTANPYQNYPQTKRPEAISTVQQEHLAPLQPARGWGASSPIGPIRSDSSNPSVSSRDTNLSPHPERRSNVPPTPHRRENASLSTIPTGRVHFGLSLEDNETLYADFDEPRIPPPLPKSRPPRRNTKVKK